MVVATEPKVPIGSYLVTDCIGSCKSNYHTITATTDLIIGSLSVTTMTWLTVS